MAGSTRRAWALGAIAFFVALVVYRLTLLPTVGMWDVAEFQAVPHVLGIAHPTGFPTYLLLGKLFTYWPEGSIAFRMNWLSALSAAAASAGVALVAFRLGAGAFPALAAAFAIAFCLPFWEAAVAAQPHTLHLLFAVAALGLAVGWRERPTIGRFAALGLLTGLALGNHMQFVMLLPALAVLGALVRPESFRSARNWLYGLGAGLVGLSVYAYLPLAAMRRPPINYADPTTWERFKYVVLGEQFHKDMAFLSLNGLVNFPFRFTKLAPQLAEWLTPAGAIALALLAVAGLAVIATRDWRLAMFLFVAWLVPLYNGVNYIDEDLRRYFFVSLAVMATAAAVGLTALAAPIRPAGARRAVTAALAAAPLALIPIHWAAADRHDDRRGEQIIEQVLTNVRPNAVVISWWSVSTSLWYGLHVDGKRPDVTVVDDRDIFDDGYRSVEDVITAHLGKRPVYLIRFPGDIVPLSERYVLEALPDVKLPPHDQPIYEVVSRRP